MFNNKDTGITTIEEVRSTAAILRSRVVYEIVRVRSWVQHSESRHANGNPPLSQHNYDMHMRTVDYVDRIKFELIKFDDLGTKEEVIEMIMQH